MTVLDIPTLGAGFPLARHEPFTIATARSAGISKSQLVDWCRAGLVRRMIRGVYLPAEAGDSIRIRAECLRLVVPPDCFITDRSAGWLHGADMVLAPNEHLAVPPVSFFRPSDGGRLRNGLVSSGERRIRADELTEIHGLRVTTPIRTAWDLGRLQHRDLALAGLDAMLRLGVFSGDELVEGVERFRKQRGVVQLRAFAPLADAGAQSAGESALRLRWYDAGLPRPRTQIPIMENGEVIYWLDMGLEEFLYAAEYDGKQWHDNPEARAHDKGRRKWLRKSRGWLIDPFGKERVYGVHQDADLAMAASMSLAKSTIEARRKYL